MNEPAFPCQRDGVNNESSIVYYSGMTLRDYFAAKAMEADLCTLPESVTPENVASRAYQQANAMMIARATWAAV